MTSWPVEEEAPATWRSRRPQDTRTGMPLGPSSSSGTLAFKGIVGPPSALANVVEGIADWDIPDAGMARALAIKVLPSTTPYVIVQYRTSIASSRTFGCAEYRHRHYRHVATKAQSGIVTVRPNGPVGAIIVRLRPEAAVRILGEGMQDFADAKISLGDVFSEGDVCLLEEMVSEAPGSPERYAHVLASRTCLSAAPRRFCGAIPLCAYGAFLRNSTSANGICPAGFRRCSGRARNSSPALPASKRL